MEEKNRKNKQKRTIIIVVIVVLALLAVTAIGMIAVSKIQQFMEIKETQEKLSQIDGEELKEKLIEELKTTPLYISNETDEVSAYTSFQEGINYKGYISAAIFYFRQDDIIGVAEMPCFKIQTDSNGKFVNIEYVEEFMAGEEIIKKAVANVFRQEYNIELRKEDNEKYNTTFNKINNNSGEVYTIGGNTFVMTLSLIKQESYFDKNVEGYEKYRTSLFGIELEQQNNIEEEENNTTNNETNENGNILNEGNNSVKPEETTANNTEEQNVNTSQTEQNNANIAVNNNYTNIIQNNVGTQESQENDSSQEEEKPTPQKITMPNLVGLTVEQAKSKMEETGLDYEIDTTNSLSKNTVSSQSIPAGTTKAEDEYDTVEIKAYEKVTASVRVKVRKRGATKDEQLELAGKTLKVVLDDEEETASFDGETGTCYFGITSQKTTMKVYLGDTLVKTQKINLEDLVQKTDGYRSVVVEMTVDI